MNNMQSIDEYMKLLHTALADLPKQEREHHLEEVKDHLMELVKAKEASEIAVVQSFLSPEILAKDILVESKRATKDNIVHPEYWFSLTMISIVGSFGAIALPIVYGTYNAGVQFAVLLQLIIGTGVFFIYYRNHLTKQRVQFIKSMLRVMGVILAFPLALYSISIMKNGGILIFSTAYLGAYFLVWVIYYLALYRTYKKNLAI